MEIVKHLNRSNYFATAFLLSFRECQEVINNNEIENVTSKLLKRDLKDYLNLFLLGNCNLFIDCLE